MENQIYRLELTDGFNLECYVCSTNEINPLRETKELGVVVFKNDTQIDGIIVGSELDSLIKYLTDCKKFINEFNEKSEGKQ